MSSPVLLEAADVLLNGVGGRIGQVIAMELWDFDAGQALAAGQVQFARATGTLMHLAFALNYLARTHLLTGELAEAARLVARRGPAGQRPPTGARSCTTASASTTPRARPPAGPSSASRWATGPTSRYRESTDLLARTRVRAQEAREQRS